MPTLYIIDGYAQFFRAYHAIRTPMTSPVTKEPTNMTFGFIGMLLKLLRGEGKLGGKPEYIALALDVSGDRGTFRSRMYAEYKANRPPPPEDLRPQVVRCLAVLREIGMPIVGAEGFEADDAIATMVVRLKETHPDLRVRIISKDKDLKQLLEQARVEMFDVHNDEVIDEAALKADGGLLPGQVIDYLALMGDNADNVPGVDGIGPKTAAQMICEFGSLDAVLAEAAKEKPSIKGKRLENIRAAAPRLGLSRDLVTLRTDAPIEFDVSKSRVLDLKLELLAPVLRELGFNRYQDELKLLLGSDPKGCGPAPAASGQAASSSPTAQTPVQAGSVSVIESKPAHSAGGLFDQLSESPASAPPPIGVIRPQSGEYRCITTARQLKDLVDQLRAAEIVAVDTETTGLSPRRCDLVGICLSIAPGTGVYVPVLSPDPSQHLNPVSVMRALQPVLEDPNKPKCGHNLKFDALVLRKAGVRLAGFRNARTDTSGDDPRFRQPVESVVFDSMVASFLIDATRSSHGLDSLSLALLGRTNISIKQLIGTGPSAKTFDQVPLDAATQYAAEDADVALQLRAIMLPQLRAMGLMNLFTRVEMPLVEVLAELEWNGIVVDPSELECQRSRLQARIDVLKREVDDAAMETIGRCFNPDSPKQLASVLFNKPDASEPGLGLKPIKKTKTGYSTDAEVLETLAEDAAITTVIPRLIVEHRELSKLVGTYLVALHDEINPDTGRIHSSFNQTVAVTGRLASSDPNLQNIPIRTDVGREIRRAFIAAPGCVLVSADYSQIELRLLAHLSKDPALIAAFHEGQDIHTAVAAQVYGVSIGKVTKEQRNSAKMVNFGIVYGVTAFGLARRLGISNTQADEIITGYKKRFAGITTFLQECIEQATRFGFVETMLGRRRPLPDITSTNPSRRAFSERNAINSVVQGSAADLIKLAMVDIHAAKDQPVTPRMDMLLQIHDELVFECPKESAEDVQAFVVRKMEGAMTLSVPLRADAGYATNWFDD